MENTFRMCGIECVGNLNRKLQQFFVSHGLSCNATLESLSIQQFHRDKGLAFVLVDLMNRADIRMVEGGGGSGLTLKTLQRLVIARKSFWQELQGYAATQLRILGLIDHPHAATAKLSHNPVMGDDSTDHARGC